MPPLQQAPVITPVEPVITNRRSSFRNVLFGERAITNMRLAETIGDAKGYRFEPANISFG